jgi:hypothetical protein
MPDKRYVRTIARVPEDGLKGVEVAWGKLFQEIEMSMRTWHDGMTERAWEVAKGRCGSGMRAVVMEGGGGESQTGARGGFCGDVARAGTMAANADNPAVSGAMGGVQGEMKGGVVQLSGTAFLRNKTGASGNFSK